LNTSNLSKLFFIRANKTKFGGAEMYLSRLSSALDKQNVRYGIVNSIFPNFLPSWLRAVLFNLQVCSTKGDKFYFSLDRVTCPDIYRAGDGVHKVFLTIEKKSKLNPLHPIYLFLEKRCFGNAKRIIAISNMVKKNIIDSYGIDKGKIRIVYNGIELKEYNFKNSFNALASEFLINPDQKILLYVGSGFKRKGVEEFLKIVSMLKEPNIKAFIIGKEKNIRYYQQLSKDLDLDEKVVFTGPREDVDNFYTISDIFLFPTHYEPFGNVILEAMNFKNVVITTKQCGGGEILDDDFIMDNPQDFSIVQKINVLLSDEVLLKTIQENNSELSKKFSIEKNLAETLKIINEVIN
jgi:UDP-glucose:(heptosyl)LPS alpha-1,3-glucosyltransferase